MKTKTINCCLLLAGLLAFRCTVTCQVDNRHKYQCYGEDCLNEPNVIKDGIYNYDTLLVANNIQTKLKQTEYIHKGKPYELYVQERKYDSLGRNVSSISNSKNEQPYITTHQYLPQSNITIITNGDNYITYREAKFDNQENIISNYYVRKKKNKIKSQCYYAYVYTENNKAIAQYYTPKKDTSVQYIMYKRYYENDTGQLMKAEHYRKNKIFFTQIYECDLLKEVKPGKDSSKICINKGTDDRGYTYTTNYTYNHNQTFKHVSITNPEKKLVSYKQYFVNNKMEEIEMYSMVYSKDSNIYKRLFYNRKYTKLKASDIQVTHFTEDKKIAFKKQSYVKHGKERQRVSYFKYYENGLVKSAITEFINRKGRRAEMHKERFYYIPFNF